MMKWSDVLKFGLWMGPLLWGIGFIAPTMSAVLEIAGYPPRLSPSAAELSLVFGAVWGAYARWRGSWL